jgi:hypothetical protein
MNGGEKSFLKAVLDAVRWEHPGTQMFPELEWDDARILGGD